MCFYSMLQSETKNYDQNFYPHHVLKIFNWPFYTKEIPYFAHWKFNKQEKEIGYEAFNEHSADQLNIASNFNIWNKKKMMSVM